MRRTEFAAGVEVIRQKATDVGSISAMERSLQETVDADYARRLDEFSSAYLGRLMCSSPDDNVRNMATDLVVERHILSKVHTKYAKVDTEQDLLGELVPRTLHELKDAILWTRLQEARSCLPRCPDAFKSVHPDVSFRKGKKNKGVEPHGLSPLSNLQSCNTYILLNKIPDSDVIAGVVDSNDMAPDCKIEK